MEYLRLIKKGAKSKTLVQNFFGYGLIKLGYADKYLAGQVTMYRSYNWVKRHFVKELNSLTIGQEQCPSKKRVWICWLQGIENAPKLVRDCYNSVEYWLSDWEIIVVTADNYNNYTELPVYIQEKWEKGIISNTHFSDILRIELLTKYGGVWIDSTVLCSGKIPKYVDESDFFVFRNDYRGDESIMISSWFMQSTKNYPLLVEVKNLLHSYWQKNNKLKHYYLLHFLMTMVMKKYKNLTDKIPFISNINPHVLQFEYLFRSFDEKTYEFIKSQCFVHKLSYKFNLNRDLSNTFYEEIIKNKNY